MEKTECYYFTVPRSARIKRDWESIAGRIDALNSSCQYLYLERVIAAPPPSRTVTLRFIYITRANRTVTPLRNDLAELRDIFGCKIELLPIRQRSAPKEVCGALVHVRLLMAHTLNNSVRGHEELRLISETADELLCQADQLNGFSSLKEICSKFSTAADRLVDVGKAGNFNTVIINDCAANEFLFADLLYALLVSKGIVTDHRIVHGDLDDAARTTAGTGLFYFISERWQFGEESAFRFGMAQDEAIRLLCRRKNIYMTVMTRAQYEKASALAEFKMLFPNVVEVCDPGKAEKLDLLQRTAKDYGFSFDPYSFRNSTVLQLPYPLLQAQLSSVIQSQLSDPNITDFVLHASDFDPLAKKADAASSAMDELERLVGLEPVKTCVREIVSLLKKRGRDALPCLHMVFRGNPGTGKTTVARLIGRMFGEIGVIKDGEKFVETDRNGLVSQYLGGTSAKTESVVKDALGGVLFIDEAYALSVNGAPYDYGHEAIDALVKRLEDHRKDFVCIMAGYTEEMGQMLGSNPGLRDRIQFYIDFPDYSVQELVQIYCKYAEEAGYQVDAEAKETVRCAFDRILCVKDQNFSNARLVRKVFERTRIKQALRADDNLITAADLHAVFAQDDLRRLVHPEAALQKIGFSA